MRVDIHAISTVLSSKGSFFVVKDNLNIIYLIESDVYDTFNYNDIYANDIINTASKLIKQHVVLQGSDHLFIPTLRYADLDTVIPIPTNTDIQQFLLDALSFKFSEISKYKSLFKNKKTSEIEDSDTPF